MVALLDADIIAYRAASVAQDQINWGDGYGGPTLNTQQGLAAAKYMIEEWTRGSRQNRPILCWTSENNFRREVDPTYKANRKGEKPALLKAITKWMQDQYESYSVERLEADDVMGIYHTSGIDSVIVSIDKDMRTVPGKVFNPDQDRAPRRITLGQADRFWMLQTLMGDRTDGITGIPKIGPKKAENILGMVSSDLPSLWSTVVSAYENAGLTIDDALKTARLTRILRAEDYDKSNMEIRLWHPTKTTLTLSLTTPEPDANPSTSSSPKDSDSTKETSSSTSVDGDEKEDLKTSEKRGSTSNVSRKRRRKPRRKTQTTSSGGTANEVAQ